MTSSGDEEDGGEYEFVELNDNDDSEVDEYLVIDLSNNNTPRGMFI